ncbi:MAG: CarD family transcriptional regulator [Peptococcaceae bacterium]|jgi:CarD family transcriptional regulator|nr:CarD family transcriptional regulator [Peptococcaceae bacterium]
MYQANDTVMYSKEGICVITEIAEKEIHGNRCEYYVLKPVYNDKVTIFVPVHKESLTEKIWPILSAGEVYDLIRKMPDTDTIWIDNDTERRERYKKILTGGDRSEMIGLIKTLYFRHQSRKSLGKQMCMTDKQFMKDAERVLYEEVAYILNIDREQVIPFIVGQLQTMEEQHSPA